MLLQITYSTMSFLLHSVIVIILSGAFFLPWLAVTLELYSLRSKKAFPGLCAHQIAKLAWLSTITIIAAGLLLVWWSTSIPINEILLADKEKIFNKAFFIFAAVVIFLLSMSFYYLGWKKLRKNPGAHLSLGLLSIISGATTLVFFIIGITILQATPAKSILNNIFLTKMISDWVLSVQKINYTFFLANVIQLLSLASALALCWILLRRNRDDFGRDYYNFAIPCCARAVFYVNVISIVCGLVCSYLVSQKLGKLGVDWKFGLISMFVLQVACCILAYSIFSSKTPLRRKTAIWMILLATLLSSMQHEVFSQTAPALLPLLQ